MTINTQRVLAVAFASTGLWATAAHAGLTYTSLAAPLFGGAPTAWAMNNTKLVVGTADYPVGFGGRETRAVTWATGTGASVSPTTISKAFLPADVNANGVVAGLVPITTATYAAGVLDRGVLKTLHATDSTARALNAQSWVIGDVYRIDPPNGQRHITATLWHDGLEIPLPVPDSSWNSESASINDAGQIVGTLTSMVGEQHAVRWSQGVIDWTGPDRTLAAAINASGQILVNTRGGYGHTGTAAVWTGNTSVQLVPILANANVGGAAMNASGDVVGSYGGKPFVWKSGVFHDLMQYAVEQGAKLPSGTVITEVLDINDRGDILVRTSRNTGFSTVQGSARLNVTP
jgi:uncharacterized membrane protein